MHTSSHAAVGQACAETLICAPLGVDTPVSQYSTAPVIRYLLLLWKYFLYSFLLFWGVGGVFSQIISRHLEPERSGKVKATISFGKMAKKAAEIAVKT